MQCRYQAYCRVLSPHEPNTGTYVCQSKGLQPISSRDFVLCVKVGGRVGWAREIHLSEIESSFYRTQSEGVKSIINAFLKKPIFLDTRQLKTQIKDCQTRLKHQAKCGYQDSLLCRDTEATRSTRQDFELNLMPILLLSFLQIFTGA